MRWSALTLFLALPTLATCAGNASPPSNPNGEASTIASAPTHNGAANGAPSGAVTACASWRGHADGFAKIVATYTLASSTQIRTVDPLLSDEDVTQGVANGALVDHPGPGSGLDYLGACDFVMLTDRGPNEYHFNHKGETDGRVFPLLPFTPTIAHVHTTNAMSALVVDRFTPIVDSHLLAVTGLPSADDSRAYEAVFAHAKATSSLEFDEKNGGFLVGSRFVAGGLDTEDVRRLPSGDLLAVDEYGPSFVVIDALTGQVKIRYAPIGFAIPSPPYPIESILPPVLLHRRPNKGFEGVAIDHAGEKAYAILETSLGDEKEYGESRVDRIVAVDTHDPLAAKPIAQYLVMHEPASRFGPNVHQATISFNALTWLRDGHLLALERVSGRFLVFDIDLTEATPIVDSTVGASSLDPEAGNAPAIVAAKKTLVFDSADLPTGSFFHASSNGSVDPDKIEGLAVIDDTTIAVANDNDFGIGWNAREATRIWILRTKAPL